VPRPLRNIEPNGIYHVTSRGNRKQPIELGRLDCELLEGLAAEAIERYELICITYCLMDNHFHFIYQTPHANLSAAMQWKKSVYAQKFNWRHGKQGHLFQGRFFSRKVKDNDDLIAAAAYVLRNPLEAGICEIAEQSRWSSYRTMMGARSPVIPVSSLVLDVLDPRPEVARRMLRELVHAPQAKPYFIPLAA
jgi:REP element-mobilizing transposase RayT